MTKKALLLCWIGIIFPISISLAQKNPIKFGYFPDNHLRYSKCDFAPEAEAVVLISSGVMKVSYERTLTIEYHFRIKILDEKAKNRANIVIPYWVGDASESISKLEAQTINPRDDYGYDRFPVNSNQIFEAKVDKNMREKRFTFPNVRKGSIIEYKFTKTSNRLFSLEGWTFSQDIPVLYSEYSAELYSDLTYSVILQGLKLKEKYMNKTSNSVWVLENIPALVEEPFVPKLEEYAEEINFQLNQFYNYRTRSYEKVMPTWEQFANEIIEDKSYSGYIDDDDMPKIAFENIKVDPLSDINTIKSIHQYVRDNFNFSGKYRAYVEQTRKEFEKTKQGNSTEINSYLAYLLRQARLKVFPVMVSTRGHGKVTKDSPLLSQFNHQLVIVYLKDKYILLDATNPMLPYNILPINMLNHIGFEVNLQKANWITIPISSAKISIYNNIDLSDLTKPIYHASYKFQDYAAYEIRSIFKSEGLDKFKKAFEKNTSLSLQEFEVLGLDSLEKPIQIKAKYTFTDLNSDMIYLSPLIWNYIEDNPFNTDKRNLPIEFPFKEEFGITCTIKFPTNFEAQDLPKNVKVLLPEKMGEYNYHIGLLNDVLSLRVVYKRERGILVPEFYTALKEFYTQMIAKQQEQVVLKKK